MLFTKHLMLLWMAYLTMLPYLNGNCVLEFLQRHGPGMQIFSITTVPGPWQRTDGILAPSPRRRLLQDHDLHGYWICKDNEWQFSSPVEWSAGIRDSGLTLIVDMAFINRYQHFSLA